RLQERVRFGAHVALALGTLLAAGVAAGATLPASATRIALIGVDQGTPCTQQICTVDGAGRSLKPLTNSASSRNPTQRAAGERGRASPGTRRSRRMEAASPLGTNVTPARLRRG